MQTAGIFLLPNGTFFVELAVFLVLIFLIGKYILPPLNRAMESRQAHIRNSLEAADAARADAAVADDERRAALEQARHQAREIVAQANRTADQVRSEAQGRGQAEYDRILAQAGAEVALARQRAVEEAASRMGEIVLETVELVIGREVDLSTHRDLIDQAVAALTADAGADGATAGAGGAPVNPSLQGYAAAVLGAVPAGSREQVAAELRAVDALISDSGELFTALTDTAVPAPARRAVLAELLQGKVSDAVRRVSVFAGGAVSAPEVPVAIAWLCVRAAQLAEGDVRPEPPLGLMAARRRVAGFATAVFEELPTDELEDIEDELFRLTRTVEGMPALRHALGDRDLPLDARHGIVDDLIGDKVRPATLALVHFAIEGGRARDIVGTLDFLVEQTAAARGWRVARVLAGQPVDDDERRELSAALTRLAGSPVELQVTVDPHLLSGVLVRVGDLQVDSTARGRLDALREHLLTGTWDQASYGRPDPDDHSHEDHSNDDHGNDDHPNDPSDAEGAR